MFAIVAELPLGVYRANGADGRPERMPSVARLHSALLCAAGVGPRAVPNDRDGFTPCEADKAALRWLEDNPPHHVHIPRLDVTLSQAVAYRDDGTLKKSKTTYTINKGRKPSNDGVAVDGRFVWAWREDPPPAVVAAFEALCPDVPYLGSAESPVRMRIIVGEEVEVSHEIDRDASIFTTSGTAVERPLPGRLDELTLAHRATGSPPTPSRDKYRTDEKSLSPVPPRQAVEAVSYRAPQSLAPTVPWEQVALIPLDRGIPEVDRVRWAVALHKALVTTITDGVPPLITGVYPAGASRPANRVALHFLDSTMPATNGAATAPGTLAVLVPQGADSADLEALFTALDRLSSLRGPGGRICRLRTAQMQVLAGHQFWRLPADSHIRMWRTVPAAVPDIRGVDSGEWTFAHAALLSLGFVFKDRLPTVSGRGSARYRAIAAAAASRGAAVVSVQPLRRSDVTRFAHTVHPAAVVRPYEAGVWLGDLAGPSTVVAIGQSRHLGGGLLVPFDVPDRSLRAQTVSVL